MIREIVIHVSVPSPGADLRTTPRGTHGLVKGFAAKICPRYRGIRVLSPFSHNSAGIYPRDLLMLCCHEVKR